MTAPVDVIPARDVPLGGLRALDVRRTLPHRDRSFVGAWCFADHYGPEEVGPDGEGGMVVPPHPHTGLQTVSWLFDGEIEHRDSGGVLATVRPGEVNLMHAGRGIAHSEVTTPATERLAGVQLWVALPRERGDDERAFQHFAPERAALPGGAGSALVFIGALRGVADSPVVTATPLLGAQLDLAPGADLELDVDPSFEHAVLVDTGAVTFAGQALERAELGVVDPGPERLHLAAAGDGPARVILLGGAPFREEVVMWWNFMAPDHDAIVAAREEWEARSERFGETPGWHDADRIPAPPLPSVRLKPRGLGRRGTR